MSLPLESWQHGSLRELNGFSHVLARKVLLACDKEVASFFCDHLTTQLL